jgi:hypothetical protein
MDVITDRKDMEAQRVIFWIVRVRQGREIVQQDNENE